ncbi:unnamed protein product [Caenorhabditis auriculariae]|uniref:polynucleotide adenylyltransferase n=1 Tax=Caenorhabditis auriculariae TaxID=2777116 RepID=A0A8S1HR18_9PELO|nr:unnamed protein product [Caenorhabditis auriculariae]
MNGQHSGGRRRQPQGNWPRGLAPHGHSHRMPRQQKEEPQEPVTSTAELARPQVKRLKTVLEEKVDIHGRGNFPTISTRLVDLIVCVREKLRERNTPPKSVKLNGGAASFVASCDDFSYADVDLIFPMEANDSDSFDKVREAVFSAIVDLMPECVSKEKLNADTLKDVYIRKMVKVSGDDDRWSLFSLNNDYGRCIELKFVDRMRRQFEFSVDSFQICLDPLIDEFDAPEPAVLIESVFGDIHQAMNHLNERLIDTKKPEEIRGGGLLKYCHLIIRGYKAAKPGKCRQLERYMCSRFFIDFPDVLVQEQKLRNYLESHFGSGSDQWSSSGEDTDSEASTSQATTSSLLATGQAKYDFLMLLHRVISESTVCLMSHERRQTLSMIDRVAFQVSLSSYNQPTVTVAGHTPRTTLLYLPPNSTTWIPVI